jgi:hypothetical protein
VDVSGRPAGRSGYDDVGERHGYVLVICSVTGNGGGYSPM